MTRRREQPSLVADWRRSERDCIHQTLGTLWADSEPELRGHAKSTVVCVRTVWSVFLNAISHDGLLGESAEGATEVGLSSWLFDRWQPALLGVGGKCVELLDSTANQAGLSSFLNAIRRTRVRADTASRATWKQRKARREPSGQKSRLGMAPGGVWNLTEQHSPRGASGILYPKQGPVLYQFYGVVAVSAAYIKSGHLLPLTGHAESL